MNCIVLDKSAVVAAKPGVFRGLASRGFRFLLTDSLLYEIASEKLAERNGLSRRDALRLDARVAATLAKARETGDEWIEMSEAVHHEIVTGKSSRSAGRLVMVDSFSAETMLGIVAEVGEKCLAHDEQLGCMMSIAHAPQDEDGFTKIRGMDEHSLFLYLERQLSSPELLRTIPNDARNGFAELAQSRGTTPSPCFLPDRHWLTYGITLAMRAYLPWKFWRFGDGAADPRKPPNPFYDLTYVGFMSLGDGILSCDMNLLKLAWTCWPEKRHLILRYDMATHVPVRFCPDWACA